MKKYIRKRAMSFVYACEGIVWAFHTHTNFRIHLGISLLVLLLGFALKISFTEMVLIVFAIVLGLSAEMINTSIEAITDLVTQEWKKEAKIAKDVSAGMMLLTAAGTVIIALIIFIPYIRALFIM